jgi:phosphoglycerate dehydrogenase-like enzyme
VSKHILITAGVFSDLLPEAGQPLVDAGLSLKIPPRRGALPEDELIEQLQGCWAVIAATDPYTERVFAACPDLKVVARWGIGYDSVDVPAATRHGVLVLNTPGVVTEAVADMTFALLLGAARRLPMGDRAVRSGQWPSLFSSLVHGKTLGLVGLGQIGQAVARRAAGFSMRLVAHDPMVLPAVAHELGVELVSLETVLAESDYVSLHCTMCEATRQLIGPEQLALMKSTAFLINAGRGGLVDQAALTEALQSGSIAGAGLDVLGDEPPDPTDPLLQCENVVFMPHCSSFTHDTVRLVNARVCANVLEALSGKQPTCLINCDVWEE